MLRKSDLVLRGERGAAGRIPPSPPFNGGWFRTRQRRLPIYHFYYPPVVPLGNKGDLRSRKSIRVGRGERGAAGRIPPSPPFKGFWF